MADDMHAFFQEYGKKETYEQFKDRVEGYLRKNKTKLKRAQLGLFPDY